MDTHTWIWLRFGTLKADADVMRALRNAADQESWFVSAFSFYEIAHAVQRKRLELDMPLLDWLRGVFTHGMPKILEITPEIAAATLLLPAEFHGDPGDRLVVATAITYGLRLCTHDKALLRFGKQGAFDCLRVSEAKEEDGK